MPVMPDTLLADEATGPTTGKELADDSEFTIWGPAVDRFRGQPEVDDEPDPAGADASVAEAMAEAGCRPVVPDPTGAADIDEEKTPVAHGTLPSAAGTVTVAEFAICGPAVAQFRGQTEVTLLGMFERG
jgi:hypothetical protein